VVLAVDGIVANAAIDVQTSAEAWEIVILGAGSFFHRKALTHNSGPHMRHSHRNHAGQTPVSMIPKHTALCLRFVSVSSSVFYNIGLKGAANTSKRRHLEVDVEYVSMARDGAGYAYGKLRTRRIPKSCMAIEGRSR
jgi:hypothetical protein